MHIGLLTELVGQRTWHQWLAAGLAERGHTLTVLRPRTDQLVSVPNSVQLALKLDPILFKLKGEHAFDQSPSQSLDDELLGQTSPDRDVDVLIDISSAGQSKHEARRRVSVFFNGQSSELSAIDAILGDVPVVIGLHDQENGQNETGRPGIERPNCLSCALDNVFSAVVELLVERIANPAAREIKQKAKPEDRKLCSQSPTRYVATTVATKVAGKVANKVAQYLDRACRARASWGIGVRRLDAGTSLLEGPWPRNATFDLIPDDNRRYLADPFVVTHGGQTHMFVEEVPMATGRGIISVADLDESGRVGTFRPVIEQGFHLSYPFVFTYDETVWMLPEACESGSVDLYRAVNYPDRWEVSHRLLDGVPGCDATIVAFGGRYFMVLTATRWLGTTWDKQRVYHADTPLGPWTEIDGGLVHIDCTRARPAGAPVMAGGRILRPAQDCSRGYGSSMTMLEVQHLSPSACRETPVATIRALGAGYATHTYSTNGTFEVVDVCGSFGGAQQVTLSCVAITASVFGRDAS